MIFGGVGENSMEQTENFENTLEKLRLKCRQLEAEKKILKADIEKFVYMTLIINQLIYETTETLDAKTVQDCSGASRQLIEKFVKMCIAINKTMTGTCRGDRK